MGMTLAPDGRQPATMQELKRYIDRLRVELSTATAAAAGTRKVKKIRLRKGKGF